MNARKWLLVAAAFGVASASASPETALSDGEVWNQGVEYFHAGDTTNALRVLRPLMLSKSHGARAAEVVAKLEYDRGNREEAASASQIVLRNRPDDARTNRNFTRAVDGLAQLRETKRINDVLKAAEGKDPGAMLRAATKDVRELLVAAAGYRTNAAERAVALADSLGARAHKLADTWLPVREAIASAVTNEEQAATIVLQINEAEQRTKTAALELGDMEDAAYSSLAAAEQDFTRFLKLVILPPAAMDEDQVAQSNAWLDVEMVNARAWQAEALDYTRAFRARFPAWAVAYEQAAHSDTNKPPFTHEAQAKVSALATQLEKLQIECSEKSLPPKQEEALALIAQIRELLPKDQNSGQSGSQQSQPQGQSNQSQQQDGQGQDERNPEQPDGGQQPEGEQEQDAETKDEAQSAAEGETPEDKELDALLKKAQERNDEHEADKRARMRKAVLPPNERDW